jgi:hypothetical protein
METLFDVRTLCAAFERVHPWARAFEEIDTTLPHGTSVRTVALIDTAIRHLTGRVPEITITEDGVRFQAPRITLE